MSEHELSKSIVLDGGWRMWKVNGGRGMGKNGKAKESKINIKYLVYHYQATLLLCSLYLCN